jgi:hypothetical protein
MHIAVAYVDIGMSYVQDMADPGILEIAESRHIEDPRGPECYPTSGLGYGKKRLKPEKSAIIALEGGCTQNPYKVRVKRTFPQKQQKAWF